MNDINAACAGAAVQQPQAAPRQIVQTQAKSSIESRLAKLDELLAKNLISAEEHQTRRKSILDEI